MPAVNAKNLEPSPSMVLSLALHTASLLYSRVADPQRWVGRSIPLFLFFRPEDHYGALSCVIMRSMHWSPPFSPCWLARVADSCAGDSASTCLRAFRRRRRPPHTHVFVCSVPLYYYRGLYHDAGGPSAQGRKASKPARQSVSQRGLERRFLGGAFLQLRSSPLGIGDR